MARPPATSAGWLAGAAGHGERGRLGDQRRDLRVLLLVAGLQRGDLRAELRVLGIGNVDGRELLQVRDAPQLQAHMRRELQVRPVAVEVLDHVHGAVLELPAELGANDVRLHDGVGPDLAHQLQARFALLIAHTGLEGYPVDVEDHGLLLLLATGGPPGAPVSWRLVVAAMGQGPGCLLAVSLAPVCVRCHHAGCVITCRIRVPAGATPRRCPDRNRQPPALTRGTAASRPSRPPAGGISGPEPRKRAMMTVGT